MPYKRTYRRSATRRPYRRRQTYRRKPRGNTKKSVVKRVSRYPALGKYYKPMSTFRLKYCQNVAIAPGGASGSYHTFRANSIFDPDFTGVGHQPLGHDQLAAWWGHYTVVASKIFCTFTEYGSAEIQPPIICSLMLNDDTTTPTAWTTICELSRGKTGTLTQHGGGPNTTVKLSETFSARKFFGNANPKSDDTLGASMNQNPTRQAYFTVGCQSADQSTTWTNNVSCQVSIYYYVQFSQPALETPS